jgi:hypothetical protein
MASSVPSLTTIQHLARLNQSAVRTYSGKSLLRMHRTVVWENLLLLEPLPAPLEVARVESEFVISLVRGGDYKATYRQFWVSEAGDPEESLTTEKKRGRIVESLSHKADGSPDEGKIEPARDAVFPSLGLELDPFSYRADVFVGTSSSAVGYERIPLAHLLTDPDRVYIEPTLEIVEQQRCVRVACLHPWQGHSQILVLAWLGLDIQLTIVKQQTAVLPGEKTVQFKRILQRWPTMKAIASEFGRRCPVTLVVGRKFVEVSPQVWVATELETLPMRPDRPSEFVDPHARESFKVVNSFSEHTKEFTDCLLLGINRSTLDLTALKINQDIPAEVFEKSIFPKGISVTNFARRSFWETLFWWVNKD